MPPPPENVQQRIDAAILDAARASRPAPPREAAPKLKPAPAPAVEEQLPEQATTETLQDTPQETPVEEEHPKTQAEVVAEKVIKEEAIAEEALPSKHQEQRWHLSKRVQERMDELLAKAAVVSHKVNNYTGTDYSGIERLRRDIIDQGTSCQTPIYPVCHLTLKQNNLSRLPMPTSTPQRSPIPHPTVNRLPRRKKSLASSNANIHGQPPISSATCL